MLSKGDVTELKKAITQLIEMIKSNPDTELSLCSVCGNSKTVCNASRAAEYGFRDVREIPIKFCSDWEEIC